MGDGDNIKTIILVCMFTLVIHVFLYIRKLKAQQITRDVHVIEEPPLPVYLPIYESHVNIPPPYCV